MFIMTFIWCLFLIQTTWMTKTIALYHELSMTEFRPSGNLPQDAMFGYSVTYVVDDETLVVSAPKANTIGEVFECNIRNHNCTTVRHTIRTDTRAHDLWLGATVKAGTNFFTTCAPRYAETPTRPDSFYKYGTYSICFYSQNGVLKKLESLSNDKKEKNAVHERYMDSFGWSIDINDKNHIIIGSPAADKGRVIQYTDHSPGKPPEYISASVHKNVNYNFGYSVAYCKFKSREDIAIGSPYGKIGYGAVYLSNRHDPLIENDADQLPVGSLFSASMCSANLEGKGRSTLLVGAPTYARGNHYNRGAVFIYSPSPSKFGTFRMVFQAKVSGIKDGGYFGSAIAKLGDLNGDRKDEIAISAPYEDDGRGAVYIYSGAELFKNKAEKQIPYLQRIQPRNYRSFGLSLSALADSDENGCNELAIGVPGNNTAVLLRCMAAITATVFELTDQHITAPKLPGTFGFKSCVKINYPLLPKHINAEISVEIELMHLNAKFAGKSESRQSYLIQITPKIKKEIYCYDLTVQVPLNTSYDPMLQYRINATLLKDPRNLTDFQPSRVLLGEASTLSKDGKVWIGDCKNEKTCTPILDLKVETNIQTQYLVGSTSVEPLNIIAHNTGDTAYSVTAKINITGVLASKWPKYCSRDSDEELTCKYPALLRKDTSWETGDIDLETKNLVSDATKPKTLINIAVNLYDEFSKVKVEQWNKTITLISSSENVTVKGTTKNGDLVNVTVDEARTTGSHIDHVYSIINNGVTTWANAHATISLRKEVFLTDGINVRGNDNYDCTEFGTTDTETKFLCYIKRIEKENKFDVIVSIELSSGDLERILRKGNTTVFSKLQFELNGDIKTHSITSTLVLYEVLVPTWIIIAAALVGLILLIILAFAMYECGFLRRKNKEKLKALKKDVRRQTMRRSMMSQHNSRGSNHEDLKQLIDTSEIDKDTTTNAKSITTKAEITTPPAHQKPDEAKPELKTDRCEKKEMDKNVTNKNETNENDKMINKTNNKEAKVDTHPTKAGLKKDPRMELIIGGLQKNILNQQSEGSPKT